MATRIEQLEGCVSTLMETAQTIKHINEVNNNEKNDDIADDQRAHDME